MKHSLDRLLLAALLHAACDDPEASEAQLAGQAWIEALPDGMQAPLRDPREAAAILGEFSVGERGSVRFIDESVTFAGGGVGILAHGAGQLIAEAHDQGLSPLELFMALAPDAEPPAPLARSHAEVVAAQGRESAAPRRLRVVEQSLVPVEPFAAPLPAPLRSQSTQFWLCSTGPGPGLWEDHFLQFVFAAHGDWDFEARATVSGNVDVYTGSATNRWLGACVKSSSTVSWVVQGQNGGVWSDVVGTALSLAVNHEVLYFSSSVSAMEYRSRITNATGDSTKVGAARYTP